MLKCTSALGPAITLMGTITRTPLTTRTALTTTINHTIVAITIGLIIGTVATVTTAAIITTTIKLR